MWREEVLLSAIWIAVGLYAACLALVWRVRSETWRRRLSLWLPPGALLAILPLGPLFSPVQRLLLSTALMVGVIKCAAMLRRSHADVGAFSRLGLALYSFMGLMPRRLRRNLADCPVGLC